MPLTNHIAIYGGSFDPPHCGHMIACMWLIEALNADKVIVAPTFEHYFGKNLTPFNHRMEMCEMMANISPQIEVSDAECILPKPNTTLKLVDYMKIWHPDPLAIVIGTDLVPNLHKWHHWDEVVQKVKIVAVGRSGYNNTESPYEIHQYPIELSAVSSSNIRERIKTGLDVTGLMPHNIQRYVERHDLYII